MVRFYKIDDAWAFINGKEGPALWVVSGIHGEEPAPPLAVIQALGQLTSTWGELQFNAPVVVIPVANPSGWTTGVRLGKREPFNISAVDDPVWRRDISDLATRFSYGSCIRNSYIHYHDSKYRKSTYPCKGACIWKRQN